MTLSGQLDAASGSRKSTTKSNSQQKSATPLPKDGVRSSAVSKQSKPSGTSDKKDALSGSQDSLLRRSFSIRKQLSNLVSSGGSSLKRSLSFGKGLSEFTFRTPWSASLRSLREDVPSAEEDVPAFSPDGRDNGSSVFDSRKLVTRTQSLLVHSTRTDAKKNKVSCYSCTYYPYPMDRLYIIIGVKKKLLFVSASLQRFPLYWSKMFLLHLYANFVRSKMYIFVTTVSVLFMFYIYSAGRMVWEAGNLDDSHCWGNQIIAVAR
jgi:hypothetical protein